MKRKAIKKGAIEIEIACLLYEYCNVVCLSISNLYDSLLFLQLLVMSEVEHMLPNVEFTFTVARMFQTLGFTCRNGSTCLWYRYLRIQEREKDHITKLDTYGCQQLR